jgi:hypothetical protein
MSFDLQPRCLAPRQVGCQSQIGVACESSFANREISFEFVPVVQNAVEENSLRPGFGKLRAPGCWVVDKLQTPTTRGATVCPSVRAGPEIDTFDFAEFGYPCTIPG